MATFWIALVLSSLVGTTAAANVGVCYGLNGDNLPTATEVVGLYKKYGIPSMRLFQPHPSALSALRNSSISVALGVVNADIPNIASTQAAAQQWFDANVSPYLDAVNFSYISVGNEVIPAGDGTTIAAAISNIQAILNARNLSRIKVTTVVPASTLGASYPPSAGQFSAEVEGVMRDILGVLSAQGSPLMINVYPYFAYASDPTNINLNYAVFTATGTVVSDGGLGYSNLFDAIVDAFYSAMEKLGVGDVGVVVSETGWPSAGNGNFTNPELAATYNKNFLNHVSQTGTPKRPNASLEGFIFAMFNEDLKPAGVEQNFGLFYPNMEPVYGVFPPPSALR